MDQTWLEGLNDEAHAIIAGSELTLSEVLAFSLPELLSNFKLTLKEVSNLRKQKTPQTPKRQRSPDSDSRARSPDEEETSKNFLGVLTGDPLGARDLLPSKWPLLGEVGLRTLVYAGPAARLENPFLKQEMDFLLVLAGSLAGCEQSQTAVLLTWSRMMQLLLRIRIPDCSLQIAEIWNQQLVKIKDYSDSELLKLILRVQQEASKTKPNPQHNQRPQQSTQRPQFLRFRRYNDRNSKPSTATGAGNSK